MERPSSGRARQPVAMIVASRKALVVPRRRRRRRERFTKGALLLVAVCAAESQQRAHAFFISASPGGVHVSRGAAKRSSPRLQAEPSEEDDYSRLVRRMNRLERVMSDQNAEVEELRSSMEHMRMIIEIQARIDSCLVGEDGEDGLLLSSDLAGDTGREPDPWLVKQAIRLLRIRHRVLRAWEFDGEDLENNNEGDDEHGGGDTAVGFPSRRSGSGKSDSGRKPSGGGGAGGGSDEARRRRRQSRMRTRDGRAFGFDNDEFFEYSMYDDTPVAGSGGRGEGVPGGGRGESESRIDGGGVEARLEKKRPPKTNQDAADAAGAGVVAALMEGRRRLIVEVDDSQLRYNSPDFCHEAMAEFVELLVLPLTTALENLKARQNRCKIVIQGAHHASQVKEGMVLDAPASLQVVSLSDAKVAKKDRVVALVAPENWTGKKGRHLKRVLAEAHDAAIILINPTDADKFLKARVAALLELSAAQAAGLDVIWMGYWAL
ncbi:unnamed protein product [Ectocarpus fasciculatus]